MKIMRLLALCLTMLACGYMSAQDSTMHKQSQQLKYGYFSYKQALETMSGYGLAQQSVANLKAKYDAEMRRVEEEFNVKYEEFLDGQRDFAPSILRKRQAEIKELMEKNLAFKDEAKRQLQQAETEAFAQLKTKLANAILKVGKERGYAFILNTDSNSVPFINPAYGEDAIQYIREAARQ